MDRWDFQRVSSGIADGLNASSAVTPVRNICILREAAWRIAGLLQDKRRYVLGRGRLLHPVCHHSCGSARILLFILQKLPRALGGLGFITLLETLTEGLSQMSRLQDSHCSKLTKGGQAILSQGESLHRRKDFPGNLEAPLLFSLWPKPFPARLGGDYMQGRNRLIVPFSLT